MKFPFVVCELTNKEADIFKNHFVEKNDKFFFEGVWLRNQRPENKKASGYVDQTTQKRRYLQFYDAYEVLKSGGKEYLTVKDTFVYVSNTFEKSEIEVYEKKILQALEEARFAKVAENVYQKDDLVVELRNFKIHPKNKEGGVLFPENYCSLDVIVHTSGYDCTQENDCMWTLSTKMFRTLGKRGSPTYVEGIGDLEKYLPAQIEMGCGPSIAAGIPPLYEMHETYKVQNHDTGKFYFAENDDLITNIILKPNEMFERFSHVPKVVIKSKPTKGYETFAKLHKKGVFTGTVLNNNFDRLVKRFGINEYILRIYDKSKYLPEIEFSKEAKSLICIGTHADRRQVQKQARQRGLQIIFIDPEGFYQTDGFESYPIEAPQTGDLILKTTFENAMKLFGEKYL